MEEKDLIRWAIKGIDAEIKALDASIKKGNEYLLQLYRGEKIKSPKSVTEIRNTIKEKAAEKERLERAKFELTWEE